ncbi:MAG: VacJ family lipoprotein [Motiliproteus sp.]
MNRSLQALLAWLLLSVGSGLAMTAQAASSEVDPWEGFNRKMYSFNDFMDRNLLLPVTRGYVSVMPDLVQSGIHNFFGNLDDVVSLAGNLLQLKMHNSAQDFSRIVANTFFGIGGLIDVATPLGVPKQYEEFGQVLGYWGVPAGPYLVLPFWGPSNVRDGLSVYPNAMLHPTSLADDNRNYWAMFGVWTIDRRAALIDAEGLISGDRYSFIRDAYMQRREFLVNDGMIMDDFGDDGFGDDGFGDDDDF